MMYLFKPLIAAVIVVPEGTLVEMCSIVLQLYNFITFFASTPLHLRVPPYTFERSCAENASFNGP